MTTSRRRSHGGSRASSAPTSRSGSGPPSTSSREPRGPSTRIASPCPTSSATIRNRPSGWCATARPVVATASTSTPSAARGSGRRSRSRQGGAEVRPEPGAPLRPERPGERARSSGRTRRASRAAGMTPAATRLAGGSSSTLASGSEAPVRTTATRAASGSQPGIARTATTPAGAIPARAAAPTARASVPPAIASGTSGTTARLSSGDSAARRPNESRTTGSVAICAARETPRPMHSHSGRRPSARARSHAVIGVAHAMRPAVASADNWKPGSATTSGSSRMSPATASASASRAFPARPDSRASVTALAIAAARRTEGDAPVRTVYSAIAPRVTMRRRRRGAATRSRSTRSATMAMFQPEMATT